MYRRLLFIIILAFLIGWFSNSVYSELDDYFTINNPEAHMATGSLINFDNPRDRPSPLDRIPQEAIHIRSNQVVIDIENPKWSTFTDTKSMDPVLDKGAHAIHIVPNDPSEIAVGDIVAYRSEYADGTIIHRIIEKGHDEDGLYYILKGDNNPNPDPGKIRFNQIERVLVAIIY